MTCLIWAPGTNQKLDQLFHELREQQYQNRQDPLWANYSEAAFQDCVALSVYFDSQGQAETCSSIAARTCWPVGAYRICNRLWKSANRRKGLKRGISTGVIETVRDQISWLRQNTGCRMVFISRQYSGWQQHLAQGFNVSVSTNFRYDKYHYLTCPDQDCETCWQRIIYDGDESLLETWHRKSLT